MKRYLSALFFLPLVAFYPASECRADGLLGIQPSAPYGVFSTLSAESPGRGQAAVSVAFEQTGEPDIRRYSTSFELGISNSVSVGATIAYFNNGDDGLEDVAFGLKHRFYDGDRYGPSLAYVLVAAPDSGTGEHGTEGHLGGGLVASKRVGPVNGHLNLIYIEPMEPELDDELRLSAGIDFAAAHNFWLLGELYARSTFFSSDIDQLEARVGYRVLAGGGVYATLGAGFGLNNRAPEYRAMASLSLLLPQEVRKIERVLEEE